MSDRRRSPDARPPQPLVAGAATMLAPFLERLSVVVPVRNEAGNVAPLVEEIVAALAPLAAYEILYVDDGSDDGTLAELAAMSERQPHLRIVRHARSYGQSTALVTGVQRARFPWVATLDGDGQNDPADIPRMLVRLRSAPEQARPTLYIGWRRKRHDSWLRRLSSRVANGVRGWLLDDRTPDTGCGLKLFERDAFLRLPYFDHMHRFLPALVQRQGGRVESVVVAHRPRARGTSKYGLFDRLWVGIIDLAGVGWLMARAHVPEVIDG